MFSYNYTTDLTTNKLVILYLLEELGIPLSHSTINQYILDKDYTDYFSLQQFLAELVKENLIERTKENNTTLYTLNEKGHKTLKYFVNRIPTEVKSKADEYIAKNRKTIKTKIEKIADYTPKSENEFIVNCSIKENNTHLLDIKINVVSKKQAELICNNWKDESEKLYKKIINSLTKEK